MNMKKNNDHNRSINNRVNNYHDQRDVLMSLDTIQEKINQKKLGINTNTNNNVNNSSNTHSKH